MNITRRLALMGLCATALAGPAWGQQRAKISDGVVKIGLILDLSGPYADITGMGSATAAQMAAEDFGGKVLGYPIEARLLSMRVLRNSRTLSPVASARS